MITMQQVVIIHGGEAFLVKYLSENELLVRVQSTWLVASPFCELHEESLADFVLRTSLDGCLKQGGEIMVFHSHDDLVVPFSHAQQWIEALPGAVLQAFENRGHFNQESFPELEDKLRELCRKS